MESLNDWIQDTGSEVTVKTEEVAAPHVVQFVLGLLRSKPELFTYRDLSDWPLPRNNWFTFCETKTGERLTVSISSEIRKMAIQICIRDANLPHGEPMNTGRVGYRVDVLAGETAERYKKSIGFATSNPSFVFTNLDTVVISDNWTETITEPEVVLHLLSDAKFSASQQTTKATPEVPDFNS